MLIIQKSVDELNEIVEAKLIELSIKTYDYFNQPMLSDRFKLMRIYYI